uniref:Uncharacterized protein n=1 Tax=Anopheles stephensi TaxID=30069 RepID=A0A182YKC3_ANOST
MSAVPVVWCSDPNSSEKKQPFALQGIQLQGNITEKHVLAMKELINAASEGRLLLPTDGAIVLLDCGLSIGSMVIEGKAGKEVAAAAAVASAATTASSTSTDTDDAVGNHKSILPYRPAAANNCEPSPVDGGDCNNHNSSSSDESDRIATSDRQRRLEAAEKLRVMLERQLDGGDIDPDQPNATVSHRECDDDRGRAASDGGNGENLDDRLGAVEREIDFPIEEEAAAKQTHSSELHVDDGEDEEEEEEEGCGESGAVERVGSSLGGAGPELLYEFLCCAKCMNDPSSSCSNMPSHRTRSLTALNNSSKLLSRVLNGRAKARLYCDPVYSISNLYFKRFINYKITKSRRPVIRKTSSRSDRSSGAGGGDSPGGIISAAPDGGGGGGSKKKHYAEGSPVYATVNKKLKLKSRLDALRRSGHMKEGSLGARRMRGERANHSDTSRLPAKTLEKQEVAPEAANPMLPEIFITGTSGSPAKPLGSSSRKTSFDSTCTVSSMDSGFIDQQQRQQLKQQLQQLQQLKGCPGGPEEQPPGVGASEQEEDDGSDRLNDLSRVQIKECLVTQSRNRRKSYEEFKSLFRQEAAPGADVATAAVAVVGHAGRANNTAGLPLPSVDEKESVKARRKSYEEFKALVKICDTSFSSLKTTAEEEPEKEQREGDAPDQDTSRARKSATLPASPTTNSVGNLFKMKRKNSRRLSLKKPASVGGGGNGADIQRSESGREVVKGSTIYDILRSDRKSSASSPLIKDLGQLALSRTADEIYRKNYKIYDKLISYGSKAYKRYDKYMTYGTIYEILHRKSDAAEDVFLRKRALSEKYAKRKVGTGSHYGSVKLGTIYDILQGKHQQLQQIDASARKKSAPGPDETPPPTLSTIYDIIHSKKAADPSSPKDKTGKNRFLVKKITEEELHLSNENNRNELNLTSGTGTSKAAVLDGSSSPKTSDATADGVPPSPDYTIPKSMGQARKPARTRRFSNILSYSSHSTSPKTSTAAASLAPAPTIEEPRLDSPRLKQIAASDEDLYKSATAKLRAAQQQVQRHQLSVDELYARIGKLRKSATVASALCTKIDEVVGDEGGGSEPQATDPIKVLEPLQPTRQRAHHLNVPGRRDFGPADEIQPGAIFKSNSLDMLAPKKLSRTARWSKHMHDAANGLSGPIRKLSPLIMPMKRGGGSGEQKKSTRRLSEFTRGEFLNEKP